MIPPHGTSVRSIIFFFFFGRKGEIYLIPGKFSDIFLLKFIKKFVFGNSLAEKSFPACPKLPKGFHSFALMAAGFFLDGTKGIISPIIFLKSEVKPALLDGF